MRLIVVGIIWLGIITWQGPVFGEGCGKCGNCSGTASCPVGHGKPGKFCGNDHKEELRKLLQELREISPQTGTKIDGRSEVRRKYRIARKLRKFDDCCAREALKKLVKENACEDLGEGEVFCVKWGAESSLSEIESKKDLKELTPDASFVGQLKIIKKYGSHPHKNEFASHGVKKFLVEQAEKDPDGYDYSQTADGKMSYFGAGWRPNRSKLASGQTRDTCFRKDGTAYQLPPDDAEHCFLADYDDTAEGGDLEEEQLVVCESIDGTSVSLFQPSLQVASGEMVDAIYTGSVCCTSMISMQR